MPYWRLIPLSTRTIPDHDRVLPWLTGPQLAALWRVPVGTVKRWAHEDRWPRTLTRPTRYDPEAAQDGHDRRRAGLDR